ncbi:hypothetical protein GA0061071_101172 [Kosakonia oryzendophytica]|uniref:WavE lipopolysaccharide synthesis n=1 Tax=Kosakonia oryzendophytica TaxID=1005665 RepID=A0A1C3YVC4_9ENTR|nr:hypothetical protein [Kosakonia oryzendophytica]AMO48170.1 Hypothetical protein AKI40_1760 [Enterobacter sp. FY-07]WBT59828.1 hypothetical protein O9K67_08695 [Kosakonia oryzendophytica]SCB74047.1 hypothetical protein GA0061071_101172 [Kosakonia oryzendophytica]
MAVSVVICGLVRSQEKLLTKLKNYFDWRDQGRVDEIIYSTWINELDNYPGLRKELESKNVRIIEVEEPRLVLKGGHQLHQMLAFYYGLSALKNQDQFVLKTRVDLADNHASMLHEFEHGTPVTNDFANVGLKNRILVEYAQTLYPFLCGDAQFFGHINDLKKLVNLSAEMELLYNRLAVEQTFFFNPFREQALFKQHFYWNLPHISEIADRRSEQINDVVSNTSISRAVQGWWIVLDSYFKIGWGPTLETTADVSCMKDAFTYSGHDKLIGDDSSDVIVNQSFITSLVSMFTEEQIKAIRDDISNHDNYDMFAVPKDVFDDYQRFSRKFSDLPSPKAVCEQSNKWVISGATQHFFVKDVNDTASRRYHEQITALRRENEILRKTQNVNFTHSLTHRILNKHLSRKTIDFLKYNCPRLTDIYARYFMRKRDK